MGVGAGRGVSTDLYQLTMGAAYWRSRKTGMATFELFVRRLPERRSYLVAAGLAQALEYLKELRFTREEIAYLRGLPIFAGVDEEYFTYLEGMRFRGEVWAVPEGTLIFAGEPILRVTAPLIEAQIVETYLLATINFQTSIASKAARIVEAAEGRAIIEFGARRCHGFAAAVQAARAAWIGGCAGTSNVEAGYRFGIPVFGTAAHSFTMVFTEEIDAFRAFHDVFGEETTLLLDTYDTIRAAHLATEFGPSLRGVRLDSGDLENLAREVRTILDEAGMTSTRIMASGDLNEERICTLVRAGAPIDIFGVGTDLSTSRDEPALGGVYKLVEMESNDHPLPKMKLSQEKVTYPSRKQVWRQVDASGFWMEDVIGCAEEKDIPGLPLLQPVMREGELVSDLPDLPAIQARARDQLAQLPARFKQLVGPHSFPVRYSARLKAERDHLQRELLEEHAPNRHESQGGSK
jgi:nicotinate phosphoribosyltransferase